MRIFNAMKYLIAIALFCSCANITPLSGGDKDTTPPVLLNVSPPNESILFDTKVVVMTFDESITVSSSEKATISPTINGAVNTRINRNKLILTFSDSLSKNTTYCVGLNKYVKDLNEGNEIEQLTYSFSTGLNLDTLYIKGIIVDALTLKPINNVMVGLFPFKQVIDSLVYKERPKYLTKSLENGSFLFSNLPNEQFALFALEDLDNNNRFTLPQERVGFVSESITPNLDSVSILLFDQTYVADTIKPLVTDSSMNDFGFLRVDSLPKTDLIAQLLRNNVVAYESRSTSPLMVDSLPAGSYSFRIIFDDNNNGQWDTGQLLKKTLPEKIMNYKEPIEIRTNWDLNIIWQAIE